MTVRHTIAMTMLAICLAAAPLLAQVVTVTTDKDEYIVGETVHAIMHNAGPGSAWIVSTPYFSVVHVEAEECLFGCVGLPEVTELPEGESVAMDWDTGDRPDEPGTYRIRGHAGGDPATYTLTASVPVEPLSWSAIKTLYR